MTNEQKEQVARVIMSVWQLVRLAAIGHPDNNPERAAIIVVRRLISELETLRSMMKD